MGNTVYDWNQALNPIVGALSGYFQKQQYNNQLNSLFGQDTTPAIPAMQGSGTTLRQRMPGDAPPSPGMIQPGSVQLGGNPVDLSTPNIGAQTNYNGPLGQALGDQAGLYASLFKGMTPQEGAPLLPQLLLKTADHAQARADQQYNWQNEPVTLAPGQHRFVNGKDVASVPEEKDVTLTPQQAQQMGLPALDSNSFYQKSPKGAVSVVKTSDLLSPGRVKQEEQMHAADAASTQAAANANETPYDPSTLNNDVNIYLATGGQVKPTFGMGKVGQKNNTIFRQGVAKTMQEGNITAQDFATGRAGQKADIASLTNLQKQADNTDSFIGMMDKNIGLVDSVLAKGGANGAPIINKYTQWLRGNVAADKDVKDLDAALTAVASEAAKVRSGSMGNTATNETLQNEARRQLNDAMSKGQITSMMHDMLQTEGVNRKASYIDQINQIRGRIGGGINTNSSSPTPNPTPGKSFHYDKQGNRVNTP